MIYELFAGIYGSGLKTLSLTLWIAALLCLVSLLFAILLASMETRRKAFDPQNQNINNEKIELKDIADFPVTMWLLVMACFSFYCSVFTFVSLGKVFLMRKYELSTEMASQSISLVYVMSAVGTPIAGLLLDLTGFNTLWLVFSCFLALFAHLLLTFSFADPFVSTSLMGIALSIFAAALWPLVALIVDQNKLGTAYGLLQCTLNFGLGVFSIAAGFINEVAGYFILQLSFLGMMLSKFNQIKSNH